MSRIAYQSEIDGLRAVAVLSVLGFHGFPSVLPGGFVGVDVFFVISGYLISAIIFRGVDEKRFSYLEFYVRRVRRIFPALALVLGTCLVGGALLLFPDALTQLGLHVTAAGAFLANILLWTESGYFDADSAIKPLLHLWSLGVEEQYYLLWPPLVGLLGVRLRLRLAVLISVMILSFALNLWLLPEHPVSAFYLPFCRVWELLIGAALTYLQMYGLHGRAPAQGVRPAAAAPGRTWSNLLAGVGALAIVVALATFRADQPYPGWRALLPTLGAACIIAAAERAWVNRVILSSRVMRFFGLISYPLYLWHWPFLALANIEGSGGSRAVRTAALAASVALAWLTYRFVETPIRTSTVRNKYAMPLVVAVTVLSVCGLAAFRSGGLPQRYPAELRGVAVANREFDYSLYREGTCFLQAEQPPADFSAGCGPAPARGRPLVMLWGDSHAASLYPGLKNVLERGGMASLAQFTASACPPVLGFRVATRPHCREINDFALRFIARNRPDTVVMLASWSFYSGYVLSRLDPVELAQTASRLHELGVRNILVLGPLPRWKEHQPNVVLREWNQTHRIAYRSRMSLDQDVLPADRSLQDALSGSSATYVSVIKMVCDAEGCPLLTSRNGELYPVSWDDAHLTVPGAEDLARRLLPYISPDVRSYVGQ